MGHAYEEDLCQMTSIPIPHNVLTQRSDLHLFSQEKMV